MRVDGKVAVITGAGGDLGRGMALCLAGAGARVLVNDSVGERADETVALVRRQGGEALAHAADVTRADEVQAMVARALAEWGTVDILVNNAGNFRDALIQNMTDADWDLVVDVNLKGTFVCSRAVAPLMMERRYGKIVNISSLAYQGNIGQVNYSSAKAGIVGLTRALGLELARHGVTVNCVAPGLIDTPKTRTLLREDARERLVRQTPMRRMGEIADIAQAVLFLSSDVSKYITRQVLHVSGGMEGF